MDPMAPTNTTLVLDVRPLQYLRMPKANNIRAPCTKNIMNKASKLTILEDALQ